MPKQKPDFWLHLRFQGPIRSGCKTRSFRLRALTDLERVPVAYSRVLGRGDLSVHTTARHRRSEDDSRRWARVRNKMFLVIPDDTTEGQLREFLERIVEGQYGGDPNSLAFWRSDP